MDEAEVRKQAVKRLKAKRGFWQYIGIWAVVSIVLTVVWLVSTGGQGTFWPVWGILGMGVAALFIGIGAYGPGNRMITDSDVDAEILKMTKKPQK